MKLEIDNKDLRGIEVERQDGSRRMHRKPEKGRPEIEVSDREARKILEADTPGVRRSRGKVYSIPAPWIPDRPIPGRRSDNA